MDDGSEKSRKIVKVNDEGRKTGRVYWSRGSRVHFSVVSWLESRLHIAMSNNDN